MTSEAAISVAEVGHQPAKINHLELLGWAFTHRPTQEAYRRSTGEDVAPAIDRSREWVGENLIGGDHDTVA